VLCGELFAYDGPVARVGRVPFSRSRFSGKERDTETGLDYFGARYYASNMGRFTSSDPKMISSQRLYDPQQWNRYSYTRNNPLIYIDPDGMELKPIKVYVTGGKQEIRYIDSRLVTRLQNVVANARANGMTFTFSEVFRTQAQQDGIKTTNTKNTTGTSPHAAGLAFDVNVATSLKPNGSKSLPDLTTAAGKDNANFSPLSNQSADPPHFQANDLITRDAKGNVDQAYKDLIDENQNSYTDLEKERKDNPDEFNKKVVEIDSYTEQKKEEKKQ